jgi:hypothetical protein
MEKMSELISELRDNCHKLQTQLMEVRQISREHKSVGVQVPPEAGHFDQGSNKLSIIFLILKSNHPIPWRDSISLPIAPI